LFVWLYFETFTRFIEFSSDLVSGETGAIRSPSHFIDQTVKKQFCSLATKSILYGSMQTTAKYWMNRICTLPEDQK
jgi:hypothetical protein|tara:strand:+ start:226 stop:453 length:228 start_codon:yes stop_codon:yes gene_type:complete